MVLIVSVPEKIIFKKNHFYLTAIHGCAGIVFILSGRADGWVGRRRAGGRSVAAATLSGIDLCDYKLEQLQTWHRYSYHGLVVQWGSFHFTGTSDVP